MNDLQLDKNVIELDWNVSQKCPEKVQTDLKKLCIQRTFFQTDYLM